MSFHRSVNNFVFHSVKHVRFRVVGSIFAQNFTALRYSKEICSWSIFFWETTCRDWFRRFKDISFDVEHNARAYGKFWWRRIGGITSWSLMSSESFGVEHTNVLKSLNALGMVQKKEYWLPYDLKLRDLEQFLVTYSQVLQWKIRKRVFFASHRDWKMDTPW